MIIEAHEASMRMAMFSDFDDYLSHDFPMDYWSDEGIGIAGEMLFKFDKEAWVELTRSCAQRPVAWQLRCAEVLDLATHPAATGLLVELLASDNDSVVVAAADSLRSMGGVQISVHSIEKLQRLLEEGSPVTKLVLTDFFKRVPARY
ncbi:hypothetical protein ACTJK4_04295 [Ralstonia sp. 22111]|uniref:hypothetical protein n=1 Tax=Ralstonia sp. 22111 TaxID=3453878 RepID=UPI003F83175C